MSWKSVLLPDWFGLFGQSPPRSNQFGPNVSLTNLVLTTYPLGDYSRCRAQCPSFLLGWFLERGIKGGQSDVCCTKLSFVVIVGVGVDGGGGGGHGYCGWVF